MVRRKVDCGSGRFSSTTCWRARSRSIDASRTSGSRSAGISYVVGAAFRGAGVARRAVTAMIEELREAWDLEQLIADIATDNEASQEVARVIGFKPRQDVEPAPRRGKDYATIPWVLDL